MRLITAMLTLLLCGILIVGWTWQESETERLKSDLIGKSMGGREAGWRFRSASQIKELTVVDREEEADRRVYTITLKLEDSRVTGAYEAKAEVTYEKVDSEWQIETVGLLSMKRVE